MEESANFALFIFLHSAGWLTVYGQLKTGSSSKVGTDPSLDFGLNRARTHPGSVGFSKAVTDP